MARAGENKEFTGISALYEEPESPEIEVTTDRLTIEACVDKVIGYLEDARIIEPA